MESLVVKLTEQIGMALPAKMETLRPLDVLAFYPHSALDPLLVIVLFLSHLCHQVSTSKDLRFGPPSGEDQFDIFWLVFHQSQKLF